ncbi:MAG TPA: extracellular solute-binding protein [Candidatus Binatia bacterium]|jgi:multiple sugar transport system substrate-binding protein
MQSRGHVANKRITRREFIKTTAAGAVAAGMAPTILVPARSHAAGARKTLKMIQWVHFVPAFDRWFNDIYIKQWGEKNNTEVLVDNIGVAGLSTRAAAEVSARRGHDLFLFNWPPPAYEEQAVDMSDVYAECEKKFGKPIDLAVKSTYNPKTKKYFGFSPSFTPDPINWRKDLWDDVGVVPDSWDKILGGGRKIRQKHNIPVGIGLAQELDTAMAVRTIMYAFGAHEQDANGNLALNSKNTIEAVKFVKALFHETMTPEVFTWDPSSNNRAMLAGTISVALNAISITRQGEKDNPAFTQKIHLAKAAAGPVRRIGLEHVMDVYVIWKFAENIEGAKKFLVDYVTNFREAFLHGEFYDFPCFERTVPDLQQLIAKDAKGQPADKYKVLADVLSWATNVGYPGYANAAIDEIYQKWILNVMFAKAAQGVLTPENAVKEAEAECKRIWDKWRQRKLL